MKLVFISDIHGSVTYTHKAMKLFEEEQGDFLIILGDILYHGPRNDLPSEYNPKEVAAILNTLGNKIIAVRGNCDAEVDQMLLEFPIMSDYSTLLVHGKRLFLTHGHIFNEENLPKLCKGDILIHGHTHLLMEKEVDGIKIINPGSLSIPKGGNPNSYGILEEDTFYIKDLDANIILKTKI